MIIILFVIAEVLHREGKMQPNEAEEVDTGIVAIHEFAGYAGHWSPCQGTI